MEIVKLNTLSYETINPLLNEERLYLQRKFFWDTQYSFKLKTQLLKYRRMEGLGAVSDSKVIGYINWHQFESDLYLSGYYFSKQSKGDDELDFLDYAARFIGDNFHSSTVEGQLLCVDDSVKSGIFEKNGFVTIERDYMLLDLSSFSSPNAISRLPEGLSLHSLEKEDFYIIPSLSESMYFSYKGTLEEWITNSFGSVRGCRNFISNLYEFPVYGRLQEELSFIIVDDGKEVAAMILVCKSSISTAHIVQVSVIPQYQSKGLGKIILNECISRMIDAGYKNAVLMVTKKNEKACNLYGKFGFQSVSNFFSINYNKRK